MKHYETLFYRHAANPILTGTDWPYSINSVFNAGATCCKMAPRCCSVASKIDADSRTCVPHVLSTASMIGKSIRNPRCCLIQRTIPKKYGASRIPASPMSPNCRSSQLPTPRIPWRPGSFLGADRRFPHVRTHGVIMPPDDKDAALLPRKIGGYWALIIAR